MNDNQGVPNEALRAAVTETAFSLTLSRAMIYALQKIAHGEHTFNDPEWRHPFNRRFVGSGRSLIARGLVEHRHSPDFRGMNDSGNKLSDHWRLTRAGWLLLDLLAEAGLAQAIDRKSKLRKLVA